MVLFSSSLEPIPPSPAITIPGWTASMYSYVLVLCCILYLFTHMRERYTYDMQGLMQLQCHALYSSLVRQTATSTVKALGKR